MPTLVPMLFFDTLPFAFFWIDRHRLRQSFVYAATVSTLCLVFVTEAFSTWNLLRLETLLDFWGGCTVLSAFCLWGYGDWGVTRQTLQRVWTVCRTSKLAIGAVVVILVTILGIAVLEPLNRGVVTKVNANQRYAGTGETSAIFLKLAAQVEASVQTFVVRILDVSVPQWAMHSIREVAGTTDVSQLGHISSRFFTDPRVQGGPEFAISPILPRRQT